MNAVRSWRGHTVVFDDVDVAMQSLIHALQPTIGALARRPALVDGQLAERGTLLVTASVDHGIIDGAPAVRLFERCPAAVERGDGLPATAADPTHPADAVRSRAPIT